jgi:predicted anti-sigma-YlaC factor YlaD
MLTPVPQSDCSRAREAASARLDGELTELEGAHLDAHLLGCEECRRFLAEIRAVTRTLRAAALEAPAAPMFAPRRHRPIPGIRVAAAAAVLAVVTGGSFALGQLIGAHGSGGGTATVATSVSSVKSPRQAELSGVGRKSGRMIVTQVIAV